MEIATFLKENLPRGKVHSQGDAQRKVSAPACSQGWRDAAPLRSVLARADIKERSRGRDHPFLEDVEGAMNLAERKLAP